MVFSGVVNFDRKQSALWGIRSWGAWNVRRELKWVLRDDKNGASRVSKVSKIAKESFAKSYLGPL